MKKLVKLTFVLLLTFNFQLLTVQAQTPNQFKYQAVLRNVDGTIMADEAVTVDISILQGSATGTSVFDETHNVTTTTQGLINLNIGSVSDLSIVDWSSDIYFIEISVNGTTMGTSQLLSVPYAMTSKTAETVDYSNVTNTPAIPDDISELTDNGNLLFDGDYNSLSNLPTLFDGQWSSLSGTVPNVSIFNNDAGYLTSEVDGSVTNEKISNIVLDGTILKITEGGVTYSVDLEPLENAAYNNGYNAGYDDGYDDGNADGYTAGYNDGYDDGFEDGYSYATGGKGK